MRANKVRVTNRIGARDRCGEIPVGIQRTFHDFAEPPARCDLQALDVGNFHERGADLPPLRTVVSHDGDQKLEAVLGVQEAGQFVGGELSRPGHPVLGDGFRYAKNFKQIGPRLNAANGCNLSDYCGLN